MRKHRKSVCNRSVYVDYGYRIADYGYVYGDFSRACHVTLYTVFLCGYWRLDTLGTRLVNSVNSSDTTISSDYGVSIKC